MAQPAIRSFQVDSVIPVKRNAIINGKLNIWQRGTSFTGVTASLYTADRWGFQIVNQGTWTLQQVIDAPTDQQLSFCLESLVTTADAVTNAADHAQIVYRIEGFDFLNLYRKKFAISFWVKSNVIGQYYFAIDNEADRSYVIPYTIDSINTWEYKTLFVTTLPVGGTWNFTDGIGVSLRWSLAIGSNFHTTSFNQWINTAVPDGGSDQVNVAAAMNNYWRITGIQVEVGDVATPFEVRPFVEELALCQRYYEKSYNLNTVPGTVTSTGMLTQEVAGNAINFSSGYKVSKRTIPTLTIISNGTGASNFVRDPGLPGDVAVTATQTGQNGISGISIPAFVGVIAEYHFTADAEL